MDFITADFAVKKGVYYRNPKKTCGNKIAVLIKTLSINENTCGNKIILYGNDDFFTARGYWESKLL